MKRLAMVAMVALLALTPPAFATSGAALPYEFTPDTFNQSSLQRGARNFMNYCSGCHGLKYLRYNRLAKDLGIPEEQVKAHLMFTTNKIGDTIKTAMPAASKDWFGQPPPDLSLAARQHGPSWLYSYLMSFHLDASKTTGVDNLVLPGASMPHVLGELQGWQVLRKSEAAEGAHGHGASPFELVSEGSMTPKQYKEFVGDLTNFLVYAAEPGRNRRVVIGGLVMAYLALLTLLAFLLKHEYWKDIH